MRGVAVAAAARYLEERSSDLLLLSIAGHAEAVVEIALAQQLVGNLDLRWGRLTRVGRGLVVRPSRCSLPGGLDGRSTIGVQDSTCEKNKTLAAPGQ